VVALVAAIGVGTPAPSHAATYTVHSCRLPGGEPAPTERWTSQTVGDVTATNGCAEGGALGIQFGPGPQPNLPIWANPSGEWSFSAPPDTAIAAYRLYRVVRAHVTNGPPAGASEYWLYEDLRNRQIESCNPNVCSQLGGRPAVPRDPSNRLSVTNQNAANLTLSELCWRSDGVKGCPAHWTPGFFLYAADIDLRDDHPPVLATVSEPPADSQGVESLKVRASDRGGGLYQVQIFVDDQLAQTIPFPQGATGCVKPFAHTVPCPLSGERTVLFDTRPFPDGRHKFTLSVVDAAGSVVQSEPSLVTVDNAGRSCVYGLGARGGPRFKVRKRLMRARAGQRPVVSGYLLQGRKAIRGATVRALSRGLGQRHFHPAGEGKTTRTGRFRMHLRPGTSRKIRLAYCAPGGGAVHSLRLEVRATSSLRASRRKVTNGHSVTFRGRLAGRPIPRTGKLIEVQAFFRGHWRTFSTARTDRMGRWHFRYRFDGTRGRVRYYFRAFLPNETGYPYESGASHAESVLVRGE
jgi:hypothetical protein